MSLTSHLPHDYDTLRDLVFIFDTAGARTADPLIQSKYLSIAEHLRTVLRLLAEVDELKREPSSARAPSQASESQDPRYKHILSSDYYQPGKKDDV